MDRDLGVHKSTNAANRTPREFFSLLFPNGNRVVLGQFHCITGMSSEFRANRRLISRNVPQKRQSNKQGGGRASTRWGEWQRGRDGVRQAAGSPSGQRSPGSQYAPARRVAPLLALARVARRLRISALHSRLGQRQKREQQRDLPFTFWTVP